MPPDDHVLGGTGLHQFLLCNSLSVDNGPLPLAWTKLNLTHQSTAAEGAAVAAKYARTYFVNPVSGKDDKAPELPSALMPSDVGSKAKPFATLGHAVQQPLPPGSQITVANGSYNIPFASLQKTNQDGVLAGQKNVAVAFIADKAGLPGHPITIRAQTPGQVRFRVTFKDADLKYLQHNKKYLASISYGFLLERCQHIHIEGFELMGMHVGAYVGQHTKHIRLSNLHIHHIASDAKFLGSPKGNVPDEHQGIGVQGLSLNTLISQCRIHDIGREVTQAKTGEWFGHCVTPTAPKSSQPLKPSGHYNRRHGIYAIGFGTIIERCTIWNVRMGAQIKVLSSEVAQNLPDGLMKTALESGYITTQEYVSGHGRPHTTIRDCCLGPDANPNRYSPGGIVLFAASSCGRTVKSGPHKGKHVKARGNPLKNVRIEGNLFWRTERPRSTPASIHIGTTAAGRTWNGEAPDHNCPGLQVVNNQFASNLWVEVALPQIDQKAGTPRKLSPWAKQSGLGVRYKQDRWLSAVQKVLWKVTKAAVQAVPSAAGKAMLRARLDGFNKQSINWFRWHGPNSNPRLQLNEARLHLLNAAVQAHNKAESQRHDGLPLGKNLPQLGIVLSGNMRVFPAEASKAQTGCPRPLSTAALGGATTVPTAVKSDLGILQSPFDTGDAGALFRIPAVPPAGTACNEVAAPAKLELPAHRAVGGT